MHSERMDTGMVVKEISGITVLKADDGMRILDRDSVSGPMTEVWLAPTAKPDDYMEVTEEQAFAMTSPALPELPPPGEEYKPPRIFSKLKLYLALEQLGAWQGVEDLLREKGMWNAFNFASYIKEDYPMFQDVLPLLSEGCGISGKDLEELLDSCIDDEP